MPSGSSKMGRKIPKTPGSNRTGLDIARTGRFISNGDAARRAARTRLHRRHHARRLAATPDSHTLSKIAGSRLGAMGVDAISETETGVSKGRPIPSITKDARG